jgi:hypothetical protein
LIAVWQAYCFKKSQIGNARSKISGHAPQEITMSVQKKSLINNMTTTKKAIIASGNTVAPVVSNKLAEKRPVLGNKKALKNVIGNRTALKAVVGNKAALKAVIGNKTALKRSF